MTRPIDHSFDALVQVTGATVSAERGALNAALKTLREAEPELEDEDLALLIQLRAEAYKRAWPEMALTPTALAKHWSRIMEEAPKPTYQEARPERCPVCEGHKMVLARERPSDNPHSSFEEWAPCPQCNHSTSGSYWRADGTRHQMLDPERVRRMVGP
jgi:uncharacterized protein with PIN domain